MPGVDGLPIYNARQFGFAWVASTGSIADCAGTPDGSYATINGDGSWK